MTPQPIPITKGKLVIHAQRSVTITWCGRSIDKIRALGKLESEITCRHCRSVYEAWKAEIEAEAQKRRVIFERRVRFASDIYRHRTGLPPCAFERLTTAEQQAWREVVDDIVGDVRDEGYGG